MYSVFDGPSGQYVAWQSDDDDGFHYQPMDGGADNGWDKGDELERLANEMNLQHYAIEDDLDVDDLDDLDDENDLDDLDDLDDPEDDEDYWDEMWDDVKEDNEDNEDDNW